MSIRKGKYITQRRVPSKELLKNNSLALINRLVDPFVKPLKESSKFVFVVGCGHSGTTLLAAKIGNNENSFLVGRETNAFYPFYSLSSSKRVANEWICVAKFLNKEYVIEKTPKHVHSIPRIKRILPTSKIIAIVRNPLDNCASLQGRYSDFDYSIYRWIIDNKEIIKQKRRGSLFLVKYEDLTLKPDETLRDVCSKIGMSYSDTMLDNKETAYNRIPQDGNMGVRALQVSQPIRKNVGKWRKNLTPNMADVILKKTQQLSEKLGYTENFLNALRNNTLK